MRDTNRIKVVNAATAEVLRLLDEIAARQTELANLQAWLSRQSAAPPTAVELSDRLMDAAWPNGKRRHRRLAELAPVTLVSKA